MALLVFTAAASAMERFVLKDERTIDGKVLGESDTTLIVRTADGTVTIEKKEVVRREDAPVAGAAGGGLGGPAAAVELRRMPNPGVHDAKVDALVAGRKRASSPLPKEVKGYLAGLQPDRALDIVMTIYHDAAGSRYLRSSAVYHLKYCRGAKMLHVAHETAAADGDPYVRGRAVFALAELAAEEPEDSELRRKAEAVVRKSVSSKSSWELVSAYPAAARLLRDRAIPLLLGAARQGRSSRQAFGAIASIATEKALQVLKDEYRKRPTARQELDIALRKRLGAGAGEFFRTEAARDIMGGMARQLELPVSFALVDTPLGEAPGLFDRVTKVKVVLDPELEGSRIPVTLGVRNASLREAVYCLCFRAGVSYRLERDRIVIVKGKVRPLKSNKPPSPKLSGRTSVNFQDTAVSEAVDFLRTMTGLNIVLSPKAAASAARARVTMKADGRELRSLLSELARKTGARMVVRGSVVEFH